MIFALVASLAVALASEVQPSDCRDPRLQRYDTLIQIYFEFKNGTTVGYTSGLDLLKSASDPEAKLIRTNLNFMMMEAKQVRQFNRNEFTKKLDPWIENNIVAPYPKYLLVTNDMSKKLMFTGTVDVDGLRMYNSRLCERWTVRQSLKALRKIRPQ